MRHPAALLLLAIALGCNGPHAPPSTSNAPPSPSVAAATASSAGAPVARVGKARGPITTEAKAIDALQAAWDEEILPNNFADPHTPAVHGSTYAKAHLTSCRESYLRAKKVIHPDETVLILFSSLAALDRAGDCWEVDVPVSDSNDVFGYLDPKTGALIFSWYDVDE